ncbi:hypothetical protein V8J84_04550 [Yoonia sp. 208BN28-4]
MFETHITYAKKLPSRARTAALHALHQDNALHCSTPTFKEHGNGRF